MLSDFLQKQALLARRHVPFRILTLYHATDRKNVRSIFRDGFHRGDPKGKPRAFGPFIYFTQHPDKNIRHYLHRKGEAAIIVSMVIIANERPTSSDTSTIVNGTSKAQHTEMPKGHYALYADVEDDIIWCIDDPALILPVGWCTARLSPTRTIVRGEIHDRA